MTTPLNGMQADCLQDASLSDVEECFDPQFLCAGTQIPSGRVAGLRSLAVLSMRQGLISGNSDRSFSQLESLEALDVSDTDMGNAELQQLQALSQLRSLDLTWTKVTRPPLVSSLTSLEMGNVEVWCHSSLLTLQHPDPLDRRYLL